jgi:hypothetical protein
MRFFMERRLLITLNTSDALRFSSLFLRPKKAASCEVLTPYPTKESNSGDSPCGVGSGEAVLCFPIAACFAINKKDNLMAATTKSKAAERFAALQKRDQAVRHDIETAARIRSEKTAKLRALRLAKEAEDAAVRAREAAAKAEKPSKRVRSRAAQAQQAAKD